MRRKAEQDSVSELFATLEFKYVGILGLAVFVLYLLKVRKPSLFGGIFALLCIYLPFSDKFPFAYVTGVNLLNGTFLVLWFWGRKTAGTGTDDSVKSMALKWAGVSVLAVLLSTLLQSVWFAWEELPALKRWLDPLILYFLATRLKEPADRLAVIDAILLGTTLFAADLALEGADIGDSVRVGGGMGQANSAAAFVAAYAPFILAIGVTTQIAWKKLIVLGALFVCFWAEIQTVSRAGFLGFGVGLVVVSSLSRQTLVKLAVWGLAVLMLAAPVFLPDKLTSRFEGKDMQGTDSREAEASAEGRTIIWEGALSMVLSNPIGVGFGAFPLKIGEYGGLAKRDAHNMYLLVLAEMGYLGLLIFLAMLYRIGERGWQSLSHNDDYMARRVGLALVGGLAGLMVANFFSATMRDGTVSGYLWIMAAMAYKVREPRTAVRPGRVSRFRWSR